MKLNLNLFLSGILLFGIFLLSSCDGADIDRVRDDSCILAPQVVSIEEGNPEAVCEVEFFFIDDDGQEYSFYWNTDDNSDGIPFIATIFGLPKNKCYNGWIFDTGNGDCGSITFQVNGPTQECLQITEGVDDRGDAWHPSLPEFRFCLDNVCSCPDDITP